MRPGVIVLNGGSSSGKSSIATCLQRRLEGTWLTLGIDDLIRALSHGPSDTTAAGSLEFRPDGSVVVGATFRRAEAAWDKGLAAMAHAGIGVIIDEVFLAAGDLRLGCGPRSRGCPSSGSASAAGPRWLKLVNVNERTGTSGWRATRRSVCIGASATTSSWTHLARRPTSVRRRSWRG